MPELTHGASIRASKYVFALDCPDALSLARFYVQLLGWTVQVDDEDPLWANVLPPAREQSAMKLACQQIDNYRAPEWPDGAVPQQAHLDFHVASIDDAARLAESIGATRHPHQPSEDGSFVVFLDPVGHPFCLCAE